MFEGRLAAIHVSDSGAGPMQDVDQAEAVPGRGLEADRYAHQKGSFQKTKPQDASREITLIEREVIEAIQRECDITIKPADTRRNLLTEGVPLNHLVGRRFTVGQVTLQGIRLCEPCDHLETLTSIDGIKKALVHRGGLRAQIVSGGTLRAGDPVRPAE